MHRRSIAATLHVAATAIAVLSVSTEAFASEAAAQTVTVDPQCVVNPNPAKGSPMAVVGTGFTAGDSISLTAGSADNDATAGTDGAFATAVPAPTLATTGPGERRFTLVAEDETNGTTRAMTSFWVANLAFGTSHAAGKPVRRVTFSFSGFKSGKTIYGHYVHGRHVITERFGRATGPCGLLKARGQLFPGGHPKHGDYKVQMDQSRRYSNKSLPRVDSSITISRV
jgi:hypothetical protein